MKKKLKIVTAIAVLVSVSVTSSLLSLTAKGDLFVNAQNSATSSSHSIDYNRTNFLDVAREQQFLPSNVIADLIKYNNGGSRVESGGYLEYRSLSNDNTKEHNTIQFMWAGFYSNNDMLAYYKYVNYSFDTKPLETAMTVDQSKIMARNFIDTFAPSGNSIFEQPTTAQLVDTKFINAHFDLSPSEITANCFGFEITTNVGERYYVLINPVIGAVTYAENTAEIYEG